MKKLLAVFSLFISGTLSAQTFTPIDNGSKLHFVIKNLGINTGGDIAGMKGKIKFNAKQPSSAEFDVTVAVSTIDTDNERRDAHLKKDDYFDAEKYPTIHLVSKEIKAGADFKHFHFVGDLTIKNITKEIEFDFTAEGQNKGALFIGEFDIDRVEFGVGNKSATMAEKVHITLNAFAKAD